MVMRACLSQNAGAGAGPESSMRSLRCNSHRFLGPRGQ
jgi:hypothetical protein